MPDEEARLRIEPGQRALVKVNTGQRKKRARVSRMRSYTVHLDNMVLDQRMKLKQLQDRFPYDKLQLYETLESFSQLSDIPTIQKKANESPDQPLLFSSSVEDEAEMSLDRPPVRSFVQEVTVELTMGVATQERLLILCDDILLVAKEKGPGVLRLKARIRLRELWLSTCIDEVCETTKSPERAFVMGWPTVNYLVVFKTDEERELWWSLMKRHSEIQREREQPAQTSITVIFRGAVVNPTKQLLVRNTQTASEVVAMAAHAYNIPAETSSYQLWVTLTEKDLGCPLIGHELPYAIKMNDALARLCSETKAASRPDIKTNPRRDSICFVFQKKSKQLTRRHHSERSALRGLTSTIRRSPMVNWALNMRPKISNVAGHERGRFFRKSLQSLGSASKPVPEKIEQLLKELFRRGPSTRGIFRNSANIKQVRELKQMMNEGKVVDLESCSTLILATILKEFLRSLPDCVLCSELYDDFVSAVGVPETRDTTSMLKGILARMPLPNYELVRRFFGLLYCVSLNSSMNGMTAYNLAVCIAPSVLWPPGKSYAKLGQACIPVKVVEFLVANYVDLFGAKSLASLGFEEVSLTSTPYRDTTPSEASADSGVEVESPRPNGPPYNAAKSNLSSLGSKGLPHMCSADSQLDQSYKQSLQSSLQHFEVVSSSSPCRSHNQRFATTTSCHELIAHRGKPAHASSLDEVVLEDNGLLKMSAVSSQDLAYGGGADVEILGPVMRSASVEVLNRRRARHIRNNDFELSQNEGGNDTDSSDHTRRRPYLARYATIATPSPSCYSDVFEYSESAGLQISALPPDSRAMLCMLDRILESLSFDDRTPSSSDLTSGLGGPASGSTSSSDVFDYSGTGFMASQFCRGSPDCNRSSIKRDSVTIERGTETHPNSNPQFAEGACNRLGVLHDPEGSSRTQADALEARVPARRPKSDRILRAAIKSQHPFAFHESYV